MLIGGAAAAASSRARSTPLSDLAQGPAPGRSAVVRRSETRAPAAAWCGCSTRRQRRRRVGPRHRDGLGSAEGARVRRLSLRRCGTARRGDPPTAGAPTASSSMRSGDAIRRTPLARRARSTPLSSGTAYATTSSSLLRGVRRPPQPFALVVVGDAGGPRGRRAGALPAGRRARAPVPLVVVTAAPTCGRADAPIDSAARCRADGVLVGAGGGAVVVGAVDGGGARRRGGGAVPVGRAGRRLRRGSWRSRSAAASSASTASRAGSAAWLGAASGAGGAPSPSEERYAVDGSPPSSSCCARRRATEASARSALLAPPRRRRRRRGCGRRSRRRAPSRAPTLRLRAAAARGVG